MTLGPRARASLVAHPDRRASIEMRPDALAAAIAADRAAGPPADRDRRDGRDDVVDLGRSGRGDRRRSPSARGCGSTSTRPMPGSSAMLPERRAPFDGWERADSIVVNPHKWLFTPLDASLLLTRRMDDLRGGVQPRARSTCGRSTGTTPVRDYNEYTPQLGRRFRALKLWIQLRWFGLEGLRRRIERHIELAAAFAAGSTPTRTGSGWRRCRSRRSASAGAPAALAGDEAGARRAATPRSWTRSTGPARCSCRTRGWTAGSRSASRSATCGPRRATSSAPGSCCARPQRS